MAGGVNAEMRKWRQEPRQFFQKDGCEHTSRKFFHDQLRRQCVLGWWGCLFNFIGSEERADVERVAERRREERVMAEHESEEMEEKEF